MERRTTVIDWPPADAGWGGVTRPSTDVLAIHAQTRTDSGDGNEDIFIGYRISRTRDGVWKEGKRAAGRGGDER